MLWITYISAYICLMIHHKTHQSNSTAPGDPQDVFTDPLVPPEGPSGPVEHLNMPLDPVGSLSSPVVLYRLSVDPSNVTVDPLEHP